MKASSRSWWIGGVLVMMLFVAACTNTDEPTLLTRDPAGQPQPSAEWLAAMRTLAMDHADSLLLREWRVQRTQPADSFSLWLKKTYWPLQALGLRFVEQEILLSGIGQEAAAQTQREAARQIASDYARRIDDHLLLTFSAFIEQLNPNAKRSRAPLTIQRFHARNLLTQGKFAEALPLFQKLRDEARRLHDPVLEIYSALGELDVWAQQDRADTVVVLGHALVKLAEQHGFLWAQAQTLNIAADAHRALDHDNLALQCTEQALALAQRLADRLTQRDAYFYRARILYHMDRLREADAALQTMKRLDVAGEFAAEARFLEGQLHVERGEYGLAHTSFEQAATIFENWGQLANSAAAASNSSLLHVENGEYQRALEDERRAFTWHMRDQSLSRMARSRMNLGIIYARLDSLSQAQNVYRDALALFRRSKEARGILEVQLVQGELFLRHGKFVEAEQYFRAVANEAQPLGFVLGHARATLKLAELAVQQKRFAAADSFLRITDALGTELNNPPLLAEAQWRRAQLAKGQARPDVALSHLEAAIALQEKMFSSITRDSLRVSFFATVQDYFDEAVSLALAMGEHERALQFAERGRSRALLEAWGEEYADSTRALLDLTPPLATLQKVLPPRARVLVYRVLPKTTVLWLIARDTICTQQLPVASTALIDSTQKYLRSLGAIAFEHFRDRVNAEAEVVYEENRAWGKKFYDMLLAPVASALRPEHELYIIADGVLQQLPFGALVSPRGFFVEEENLVLKTPSLAVLYRGLRQPVRVPQLAANRLLYVGNPAGDLPSASLEMKSVTQHFPDRKVLLQHLARFDTIKTSLQLGAEVVHLSLHAVADPHRALNSYVELSHDRATATHPRAEKIYARRLLEWEMKQTWMVLLNGCETGTGQVVRGEGVLHIARLFALQRVALVVASLWKNDDRWSTELVAEFYRQLASGLAPQTALHRAKLETIKKLTLAPLVKYPLPYFWAVVDVYLNRAVVQN